ncbi:unnamed protein product [Rotaria sp. Silwood2]|nr:unnamed protein product [Rotaria sp. Silwood2]
MIEFDIDIFNIRGDLQRLLTKSATRIIVLWAESIYTSLIVQYALDQNLVGPYFTWILSSRISLNSFNEIYHQNLIEMLLIEPLIDSTASQSINTTLLNAAYRIWQQYEPKSFPGSMNINHYGLFAFDATWSLIQSLQQLCSSKTNSILCLLFVESSFCFDHRLVQLKLLLDTVSATEFLGVSSSIQFSVHITDQIKDSYYSIKNAQLSSNGLSFVPILEHSEPSYWRMPTEENVIIWPGNLLIKPTDQAMLKDVRLRIGVMESPPFTIVENVIDASGKNTTQLYGYVPDLIELLQKRLGFISDIQLETSN